MKKITLALLSIISIALINSCSLFDSCIEGNGNVQEKYFMVKGFKKIILVGSANVNVAITGEETLRIKTDENLFAAFEFEQNEEELILKAKNDICPTEIKYDITAANIESIEIRGSGNVTVNTQLQSNELEFEINGSGNLILDHVRAEDLKVEVNGSGKVTAKSGKVSYADIELNGAGDIKILPIDIEKVDAEISGSGNIYLTARQELNVKVDGSGLIYYAGDPQSLNINKNGSGGAKKIEK